MITLKQTLEQLGDLHDARVMSICWHAHSEEIEFTFEDIYANFAGLEDYPGKESGSVTLHQVKELVLDMTAVEQTHIYEFAVEELEEDEFLATVRFRSNGKITAKFKSANFPEIRHLV